VSGTIKLPTGWSWTTVSGVASVDVGFAFKSAAYAKAGIRLLRGENIQPGSLRWLDTKYWPESKIDTSRHIKVDCGDIILAMDRPVVSAGLKIARVTSSDVPCLLVQRVARLRSSIVSNDYLYYALSSPDFVKHIVVGGQTGTQLPHVSGSRIENFSVPLPPRLEQHRIVDNLDSYLTRLDAAAEGLKRVEANLKRYRASVLKAAVEGRLVPTEAELARKEGREYEPASVLLERILKERRRRWEEAELAKMKAKGQLPKDAKWKNQYKVPPEPDTRKLPQLPTGWCWATLSIPSE
jgi:type I restriction enzyme S subunit